VGSVEALWANEILPSRGGWRGTGIQGVEGPLIMAKRGMEQKEMSLFLSLSLFVQEASNMRDEMGVQ
jgi:hypothetical protein